MADVGLDPEDGRTLRKYSMGMKQRLAIAQAVMERPNVLLLDEPTNGLDAAGVPLIYALITKQAQAGAVVVIASHSIEDTEVLCDQLYRMEQGRVFLSEPGGRDLRSGHTFGEEAAE